MSTYGNGSNGALNVTSGSYALALDTKHQFTTVNVAAGATLTTGSTTGSVLYILATDSITIDGTINVSNVVNHGDNTWSVTLDGVTYSSPGAAAGGNGGYSVYTSQALQVDGFGGGGGGAGFTLIGTSHRGGNGADGSSTDPDGGNSYTAVRTTNGTSAGRNDATQGGGGSGVGVAHIEGLTFGSYTHRGTGGAGGETYGANGQNGSVSQTAGSSYSAHSYYIYGGGGGGAGGRAGRPGVRVVLKAPEIVINGTIITSGTAGTNGGNGGRNMDYDGWDEYWGNGGGGGGGGNAGNIDIIYSDSFTDNGTYTQTGGTGGSGGIGGYNNTDVADSGTAGTSGTLTTDRAVYILSSLSAQGSATLTESATIDITSGTDAHSTISVLTTYQPLVQKDYEVRVFDADWNYLSTLKNVTSEFNYKQAINQNASEMLLNVARAPDNRRIILEALQDENGNNITDNNGDIIYVQTLTANAVGPGTDIDLNYNVKIIAYYGGYEQLLDHNGNVITDENGDAILTAFGKPNGVAVYSGYIADYELIYGEETGVNVVVVPHATEMSHYIFKDGTSTTVSYLNTDPVQMARDAMDDYISQGGYITYDTTTMPLSGGSSDYPFKLQTTREAIDKTVELLPSGYYHYVHPGENKQYLLPKGTTADHTFYYQKHITEFKLRKSITQLKNKVYFIGGDTGGGVSLYKYYEDTTSQTAYRPGLERLTDSRVTLADSAQTLSEREINVYKEPRYRTTVTITDAVYDIESIRLGEMVAFKNFGTFVDELLLQIVNIDHYKHKVVLDLDMIVPDDTKRLIELKKNLMSKEVEMIGSAPS